MKSISTYRLHTPTTADGHHLSITTTFYGTEEEIEKIHQNCRETIGSGLVQEFNPFTSSYARPMSKEDIEYLKKQLRE